MKKKYKYLLLALLFISLNICLFTMDSQASSGSKLTTPTISLSNIESTGKIKVSWTKVNGAVSYELYSSMDNKNWKLLKKTTGTTVRNTSAVAGKKYYYKVRAIAPKSSLNSGYSKVKYRTCDLVRPEVTLTNIESTGKIKITWTKVEGAVSYKLYSSTDNKNWQLLKATTGTSIRNTSAVAGKKYYYKVRAIASNTAANSAYSIVKSLTCKKPQNVISYRQKVVNLAIDICQNWDTVYAHDQSNGVQNADGTYGFDCSGFAAYVMNTVMQEKIPVFRLTSNLLKLYAVDCVYNKGYSKAFYAKTIDEDNMQPGDILFFSDDSVITHCGVYIGDGEFIHSTSSKNGVVKTALSGSYKRRLTAVRRYIPETVTAVNEVEKIATSCKMYAERNSDSSVLCTLQKGSTVTVLYTGNSEEWNMAYVKNSKGVKGFIYTKNLK